MRIYFSIFQVFKLYNAIKKLKSIKVGKLTTNFKNQSKTTHILELYNNLELENKNEALTAKIKEQKKTCF